MPALRFDPTINSGHILTAVVIAGSVFLAWSDLKSDVAVHEVRIQALEAARIEDRKARQRTFDMLSAIREDVAAIKAGR